MVSLDMLRAEPLGEAVTRSKIVLSGVSMPNEFSPFVPK